MKNFIQTLLAIVILFTGISTVNAQTQTVTIGNGTAISVFSPLNRTNDYCVYEVVYLASEINVQGDITALGFQRHDGTNTDSIENVSIYLKHTSAALMTSGNIDTTGYQLVFNGSFPNDSGAGWREVVFDNPFTYDNVNNLQVLVVKGYQPAIANTPVTPRWIYTNVSGSPRARRYYGANPINLTTSLSTTNFISNAILTFLTTGGVEQIPLGALAYPNPSNGNFIFEVPEGSSRSVLSIFDSAGRMLMSQNLITGINRITIKEAVPGFYIYRISDLNGERSNSGKLIVTE